MICWNPSGQKVLLGLYSLTMRILITGGFGFLGGRLAVHLAQAGHTIVLGSRKAICSPTWLAQAEVLQTVWDDVEMLKHCCKGVDLVIHAAGMNAQDCAADPVAALAFNGVATARLVSAACSAGVKRFIYLSTAHVYASPLVGTITEETFPRNLHPYATSHLAGEQTVLEFNHRGLISGIVLRLSNVFGAPVCKVANCWMLLVNDLCKQAVQTNQLKLHSSGNQQRDFISMTDFCCLAEKFAVGLYCNTYTSIYNIGSGESQSVLAMAKTIQSRCEIVLGRKPLLLFDISRSADTFERLSYRSKNLGISLSYPYVFNHVSSEIDNLLNFVVSIHSPF